MKFSPQLLDEIKSRVSLSELVGSRVKLIKRGNEYTGLCPFHREKTPSFTVSDEKGFYHCFGCQSHGSIFDFLINIDKVSFPEAVEFLSRKAGIELTNFHSKNDSSHSNLKRLFEVSVQASIWFQKQLSINSTDRVKNYIKSRGIDKYIIDLFQVGYAPNQRTGLKSALLLQGISEDEMLSAGLIIKPEDGSESYDRFRDRVMFPIRDINGRTVAFGGRALGDSKIKYLNSPETPIFIKGKMLFGLFEAKKRIHLKKSLVVVEGYMDVISLVSSGIGNAVASLGTSLTDSQIELLWKFVPEPTICFDGDSAGRRAALSMGYKMLPYLKPGLSCNFAILPDGLDPDSFVRSQGLEAMRMILGKSLTLSNMLWWSEKNIKEIDTPEKEAGFRKRLDEIINKIQDNAVREAYKANFKDRFYSEFRSSNSNSVFKLAKSSYSNKFRPKSKQISPNLKGSAIVNGYDRLLRERFIVAVVLSHPEMLNRFEELFANIMLSDQNLDTLRSGILKAASEGILDSDKLRKELDSNDLGLAASELVSLVSKSHPRIINDTDKSDIESAWKNAIALHNRESLQKEIGDAWAEFTSQYNEASKDRLLLLQEELGETHGMDTKGNLINNH